MVKMVLGLAVILLVLLTNILNYAIVISYHISASMGQTERKVQTEGLHMGNTARQDTHIAMAKLRNGWDPEIWHLSERRQHYSSTTYRHGSALIEVQRKALHDRLKAAGMYTGNMVAA